MQGWELIIVVDDRVVLHSENVDDIKRYLSKALDSFPGIMKRWKLIIKVEGKAIFYSGPERTVILKSYASYVDDIEKFLSGTFEFRFLT